MMKGLKQREKVTTQSNYRNNLLVRAVSVLSQSPACFYMIILLLVRTPLPSESDHTDARGS